MICYMYSHAHYSIEFISGSGAVAFRFRLIEFRLISPCFAIFKNVVHSLEPGKTPSYSSSNKAQNYKQRC